MADIIHLLPDSVANQIAAGEVIQRPASVIKELVENAVDAGATKIDVLVEEAGKTSIQVIDNGKGMSETDARLAFERHATSKIRDAADLFTLSTMGFRGEALPSIAAVAQVTLKTHATGERLGTCIHIEGGRVLSQENDGCPEGSNFLVQNLFYNVPARRRFLKSNQTELSNIITELERVALVNPAIAFSFMHNGHQQSTYPAATLKGRIAAIFGHKFAEGLLCVEVETTLCHITGFVGMPDMARKKGAHQYFFVNNRYMRHPYFQRAVINAYDGLIGQNEQVPFFLYITTDPQTIDVNIHPTKTEIKFENEQAIWQILTAAVREALGKANAVPAIDFDAEGQTIDIPVYSQGHSAPQSKPSTNLDANYNPFRNATHPSAIDWQQLYQEQAQEQLLPLDEVYECSQRHYQFRGQYIITEEAHGLLIIEQHRAHVRVLYNRYRTQMAEGQIFSQKLLFPEVVRFSHAEAVLISEIEEELRKVGFDLSPLGDDSYSVMGMPGHACNLNPAQVFEEVITDVLRCGRSVSQELHHNVALIMARNGAITEGQELTQEEMHALVVELLQCDNHSLTPSGEPIVTLVETAYIQGLLP